MSDERAEERAYLLWEGRGRPTLSKENQDAIYFEALAELRAESVRDEAYWLWDKRGRPTLSKEEQDAIYFEAQSNVRARSRVTSRTVVCPDGRARTIAYYGCSTTSIMPYNNPDWWKSVRPDDEPEEWLYPENPQSPQSVLDPQSQIILCDINDEIKSFLAAHPEYLYDLPSRKFEELVASILKDFGFDVELTQPTRDGGRDIIAYIRNAVCRFLTFVECKKYSPKNKVGVEVVRGVYGVQKMHQANKSVIVTTSFFTRDAIEEARTIERDLELKDYDALKAWLSRYA